MSSKNVQRIMNILNLKPIWSYLIISLLLCCCSCSEHGDTRGVSCGLRSLHKISADTLFLDNLSPVSWGMASIVVDGSITYLYLDNSVLKSVDIYRYTNHSFLLDKRIQPPSEDKYQLAILQGYSVASVDQLYIYERANLANSLVYNGNEFEHFYHGSNNSLARDYRGMFNHLSVSIGPTYAKNNELYFVVWPLISISDLDAMRSFPYSQVLNLETDELRVIPTPLPNLLKEDEYHGAYGIRLSRIITNAQQHVYCWGGSDSLYIVESESHIRSIALNTCEYYPMFKGLSSAIPIYEYDQYYINNLHYLGIFYDSFKDRTIVVGLLPYTHEVKQYDDNVYFGREAIVLEYDANFNKISETIFEGGIYDFHGLFFSDQGMHLPRNNPLNTEVNENYIKIDLFN